MSIRIDRRLDELQEEYTVVARAFSKTLEVTTFGNQIVGSILKDKNILLMSNFGMIFAARF